MNTGGRGGLGGVGGGLGTLGGLGGGGLGIKIGGRGGGGGGGGGGVIVLTSCPITVFVIVREGTRVLTTVLSALATIEEEVYTASAIPPTRSIETALSCESMKRRVL